MTTQEQQQQQQQQDDDGGWTRVSAKSSRRRNKPAKPKHLPVVPRPDSDADLVPASELLADYRRLRPQFEAGTACRRMRALVAEHAPSLGAVTTAVNLGSGSFDPRDGAWDAKRSSFVQLAAFMIMVEDLEKMSGSSSKIRTVFQDPAFTSRDKEFLVGLGHEVVETPKAMGLVDEHTLLFGIHLYREVYAEALEKKLPAILVGTGYNVWDDLGVDNGKLDRLKEVDDTYRRNPFPQETHGGAMYGTWMYWRFVEGPPAPSKTGEMGAPAETSSADKEEHELAEKLQATSLSELN